MPRISECQKLACDLVAERVLEKGAFWEAIRRLRSEWNITPETRLPPETITLHMPSEGMPERGSAEWIDAQVRWLGALAPVLVVVPEKLRVVGVDWYQFAAACVLYDPPEGNLIEFAELRPWLFQTSTHPTRLVQSGLPIRFTSDGMKTMLIELRYRWRLLDELGRRYLEPQGLDVRELVKDIERTPGFREQYWKELNENPCRYYIEVDEVTKKQSVVDAWREIKKSYVQGHQEIDSVRHLSDSSSKEQDPLLCLQLAILHERHNEPDKEDPRRRSWPYARLADEYEDYYSRVLGRSDRKLTKRAAEEHVKTGKKMLEEAQGVYPHN